MTEFFPAAIGNFRLNFPPIVLNKYRSPLMFTVIGSHVVSEIEPETSSIRETVQPPPGLVSVIFAGVFPSQSALPDWRFGVSAAVLVLARLVSQTKKTKRKRPQNDRI
jgi:hypothetical protein